MGEFLQNMYVWLWAALAILMIIVGIKYRHEHQGLLAVLMAVFFNERPYRFVQTVTMPRSGIIGF